MAAAVATAPPAAAGPVEAAAAPLSTAIASVVASPSGAGINRPDGTLPLGAIVTSDASVTALGAAASAASAAAVGEAVPFASIVAPPLDPADAIEPASLTVCPAPEAMAAESRGGDAPVVPRAEGAAPPPPPLVADAEASAGVGSAGVVEVVLSVEEVWVRERPGVDPGLASSVGGNAGALASPLAPAPPAVLPPPLPAPFTPPPPPLSPPPAAATPLGALECAALGTAELDPVGGPVGG